MARMHIRRRGTSGSDRPVTDEPPEWSTIDPETIEERIVELAKDGVPPSQIGLRLRDEGIDGVPIPNVKLATGKKLAEILDEHDSNQDLPEDLRNLFEKAVRLRDHVDANPQDHKNKRALQNVESKVRRLVAYYRGDVLDDNFTYTEETARELIE